jgi:predicted ATP-grasp superfamily ATP-dependent carboligase
LAPGGGDRLLLLGACVRALAQSALRGRLARERFPGGIIALDFFGDADLDGEPVRVVSIRRDCRLDRTIANLGRAALALGWETSVPAGGLENRPGLLRLLARRGHLLGSPPEAIRSVRDPAVLFPWLAREDLPHAATCVAAAGPRDDRDRLLKRRRGAGGGGVRAARPGETVPPAWYLQERIDGRPGSAAFLADGHDAVLLGVSEQLIGTATLGAQGYRHAGNLVDAVDLMQGPAALLDTEGVALARRIAARLAARFALRGLAGFDFIAVRGRPHLIEVNPRWTASMELIEEAMGASLFDAHLLVVEGAGAATATAAAGVAGTVRAAPAIGPPRVLGRGVLYATEAVIAPPPDALAAIGARDRPRAGEIIMPGQPVCTLTARAENRDMAFAALETKAAAARALLVRVALGA